MSPNTDPHKGMTGRQKGGPYIIINGVTSRVRKPQLQTQLSIFLRTFIRD